MKIKERMIVDYLKCSDGDTFKINIGELALPIRVANINAPDRGYHHYKESKTYLEELLEHSDKIEIEYIKTDDYNRTVASVFVDDVNLSEHLIVEGMAMVYEKYTMFSPEENQKLLNLQEIAQENKVGIWSNPIITNRFWGFNKKKK